MDVEREEEIQTKGTDNLLNSIIVENFPNLKKESPPGVGSLLNTKPSGPKKTKKTTKKNTFRHIIIKTLSTQNRERILKAASAERQVTYIGKLIRRTADFSTQTLNARKSWKYKIQVLKESNC
jgi:hypothetical protein